MANRWSQDPTCVADRSGDPLGSLTGHDDPPSLERLEARLSYCALLGPGERFDIHINPLVAAAGGLLAQVARLAELDEPGNIEALNRFLGDQVKAFEARAGHHRVPNEQMAAARYVLCTVLDETVLNTPWGAASDWSRMSLLSRFHKETFGGEKFFHLLERLSTNPTRHLHMLELMYLCLALGFEGKYRAMARGNVVLDEMRESLFRQIRHLRGDIARELSPQWQALDKPREAGQLMVPRWQLLLVTALCLTALYTGFAWVLGKHRETVLAPFQHITIAESNRRT
jgi:type VI secretion system protein ImpK